MQLTKNFNLSEFKCKDGTTVPAEYLDNVARLANSLQALRDYLGAPIRINSSYRHESYNKAVGGSKSSQHLYARAADITADGYTPDQVADAIETLIEERLMHNGGLGRYNTFTHYDVRSYVARWDYRK
jgi:uncharacterized protein YcbK (DUF882 family)